jgi:hypothetical protein
MNRRIIQLFLLAWLVALGTHTAFAFDLDFHGSLGEGENKFKRYVAPVSSPTMNESPYITSELRPIFIHNVMPNTFLSSGANQAGSINLWALQARVALTDRLGLIATKDGYAEITPTATLPKDNGYANVALGLKYALINRPKSEGILSVGARYEAPSGNLRFRNDQNGRNLGLPAGSAYIQGSGDGFLDVFFTGAKSFDKLGLQASIGHNTALDQDMDTSMLHWGAHADYELLPGFFPLVEFNGYTTTTDASRLRTNLLEALGERRGFEGMDLVNFGSGRSGFVSTFASGVRLRLNEHIMFGAVYEIPVTERRDIIAWRSTFDFIITY